MPDVCLEKVISPSFVPLINPILDCQVDEVVLTGGRGSTKSSFYSEIVLYGMLEDWKVRGEITHAVCIRKVANTLHNSIYNQFKWGQYILGIDKDFHNTASPMKMTFKPSGQEILYFGCDDPLKIKSTILPQGYIKYIIFEEFDQFDGMREIRSVIQSLARGEKSLIFFIFNPPPEHDHWANIEADAVKEGRLRLHTDYTKVDPKWLGPKFMKEAEYLKTANFIAYQNEYMGIVTGVGGNIFKNVINKPFSDLECMEFEKVRQGLDFGFALHPAAWVKLNYNGARNSIDIFDQVFGIGISNIKLAEEINNRANLFVATKADCEEPRAIDALINTYGCNLIKCKKGKDSVHWGIRYLQDMSAINIDKSRCPDVYRQFKFYNYKKNKQGDFIKEYPDIEDDSIDATRYSLDDIIMAKGWRVPKKKV
ncbi:MAG: PBSX family phage terminase large subunit [Alphaproteobacteria bacterium]|nr:MAG: PBSX family phage terminase large subunit [Alphaproteobacteria bacterium]